MIIFQVPLINKDDYFDTFNYTSYVCVFFSNLFPSYCIYSLICTRLSPFFFGYQGFKIFAVFTCPPVPVLLS
jgi:hypothetical protein